MGWIVDFLAALVGGLLFVLEILMFLRAILSWLPVDEDSKLVVFTYGITEPLIQPIRILFDRFDWFTDSPLDVPFFVTFLIISLLSILI